MASVDDPSRSVVQSNQLDLLYSLLSAVLSPSFFSLSHRRFRLVDSINHPPTKRKIKNKRTGQDKRRKKFFLYYLYFNGTRFFFSLSLSLSLSLSCSFFIIIVNLARPIPHNCVRMKQHKTKKAEEKNK